jgi:hypothetical protein
MKMNFRLSGIGAALGLLLGMQALGTFAADAMTIDGSGQVGIGTEAPGAKLHIKDGNLKIEQTAPVTDAVIDFSTAASSWEIKQNGTTGRLTFFSPGGGATTASFKFDPAAQENLFRVGILGPDIVDINGDLIVTGSITPDYVLTSEYQLETIEEHALYMWENKHLPALSAAEELTLANQTLSGTLSYLAANSATLGPNLNVNGPNISVEVPTVTILAGTKIAGTFRVGNSPPCT